MIKIWRKEYDTDRAERAVGKIQPTPVAIVVASAAFQLVGLTL